MPDETTRLAIGVDVGGTKIAAGLVDLADGSVRERVELPTGPERGGPAVLDDVVAAVAELAGDRDPAPAVGVAVCELVDPTGAITSRQTLAWRGPEVVDALGPGSVVVESDVRAAAAAEAAYGAGRSHDPFCYLSVGTGVSSALVVGGRPFVGAHGSALVATSGTFRAVCPRCHEPIELEPESIASGLGIATRYAAATGREVAGAGDVLVAAEGGDAEAARVVDEAGAMLGTIAAWLVNVLDPRVLVVGGGLGLAGGRYRERFLEGVRAGVWAPTSAGLPVLEAQLGSDAGIVGAALAAVRVPEEEA